VHAFVGSVDRDCLLPPHGHDGRTSPRGDTGEVVSLAWGSGLLQGVATASDAGAGLQRFMDVHTDVQTTPLPSSGAGSAAHHNHRLLVEAHAPGSAVLCVWPAWNGSAAVSPVAARIRVTETLQVTPRSPIVLCPHTTLRLHLAIVDGNGTQQDVAVPTQDFLWLSGNVRVAAVGIHHGIIDAVHDGVGASTRVMVVDMRGRDRAAAVAAQQAAVCGDACLSKDFGGLVVDVHVAPPAATSLWLEPQPLLPGWVTAAAAWSQDAALLHAGAVWRQVLAGGGEVHHLAHYRVSDGPLLWTPYVQGLVHAGGGGTAAQHLRDCAMLGDADTCTGWRGGSGLEGGSGNGTSSTREGEELEAEHAGAAPEGEWLAVAGNNYTLDAHLLDAIDRRIVLCDHCTVKWEVRAQPAGNRYGPSSALQLVGGNEVEPGSWVVDAPVAHLQVAPLRYVPKRAAAPCGFAAVVALFDDRCSAMRDGDLGRATVTGTVVVTRRGSEGQTALSPSVTVHLRAVAPLAFIAPHATRRTATPAGCSMKSAPTVTVPWMPGLPDGGVVLQPLLNSPHARLQTHPIPAGAAASPQPAFSANTNGSVVTYAGTGKALLIATDARGGDNGALLIVHSVPVAELVFTEQAFRGSVGELLLLPVLAHGSGQWLDVEHCSHLASHAAWRLAKADERRRNVATPTWLPADDVARILYTSDQQPHGIGGDVASLIDRAVATGALPASACGFAVIQLVGPGSVSLHVRLGDVSTSVGVMVCTNGWDSGEGGGGGSCRCSHAVPRIWITRLGPSHYSHRRRSCP